MTPLISTNLLEGERVRLTAVTEEDLDSLSGWYEDTVFLRLYDTTPAYPRTKKGLAEMIKEEQESSNGFLFAIRQKNNNQLIGLLGFDGIAWSHGTSYISIGIGEEQYRGKGYGKETLRLALRFAFHELNLYRLFLTVFAYNEAAIKLYERVGFQREGVYREHLFRDGQRHDMYLYGLLRREWEQLNHQADTVL